jgi:hypothetical protein
MSLRLLSTIFAFLLVGCGPSGPPSTQTNSSNFGTLRERAEFLHQYVTFRRTYQTLDFDIRHQNNGEGMAIGPSYWDMRLVATVPESELQNWVLTNVVSPTAIETNWLTSIPTKLDLSGINEWYSDSGREVGIDRNRRIVAYRNWSR